MQNGYIWNMWYDGQILISLSQKKMKNQEMLYFVQNGEIVRWYHRLANLHTACVIHKIKFQDTSKFHNVLTSYQILMKRSLFYSLKSTLFIWIILIWTFPYKAFKKPI